MRSERPKRLRVAKDEQVGAGLEERERGGDLPVHAARAAVAPDRPGPSATFASLTFHASSPTTHTTGQLSMESPPSAASGCAP